MKKTKQVEKYIAMIEEAKQFFENLAFDRQDTYDNKSEKWQESEKGEDCQTEITDLEDIAESLEETLDRISEAYEE